MISEAYTSNSSTSAGAGADAGVSGASTTHSIEWMERHDNLHGSLKFPDPIVMNAAAVPGAS